jgi:predicted FMN-binding regulatory protein PaiB
MYVPPAFAVDDPVEQLALLRSVGFGHLVAVGGDGVLASTPLPFLATTR